MASITVHPATLRWAVRQSGADPVAVAHRDGLAEFPQWLNANAPLDLSFTKLSTIGSALQMPFGTLVRSVVPEAREDELIRYRTINNQGVEASRNLRDTIVTSRISWLRTQGIAISVSSGCRPVSFKCWSAATGNRSPMSFMTNGLRWMHSIADPKQHAQTLDNVLGASEHNGRQVGAVPVMEPAPRVGAGPTIHGNGRPPVVPDGPPRRYGGGVLQKRGVSERKGQRGGGGG